jgi:hypothetical protein
MKENNDIDKLLRASLDSYKPAPDVSGKKKFLAEAAGILPGDRASGAWWKPVTIAIIIIGLTGSLVWYLVSIYNSGSPTEIVNSEGSVFDTKVSSNINTETQKAEQTNNSIESKKEITKENNTVIMPNQNDEPVTEEQAVNYATSTPKTTSIQTTTQYLSTNNNNTAFPQYPITDNNIKDTSLYPIPDDNLTDSIQYPLTITNPQDSIAKTDISQPDTTIVFNKPEPLPEKGGIPIYSLFYQPEYLFNLEDDNKMMHSLGAEFQFRPFHPKYVVRAGVGISLSPGEYDYGIDYYEYMGSYQHLDSVTFTLAEDNFHLLPTYHLTEKEVYDSEVQTQYTSTDKRFVYLYIPVSLGYDFIRHDHFTFGLRTGPSVSVLLNKKASQPQYELGENQLVGVTQISPERQVMNWQVSGGLNVTFIGKNNYFIEAEPAFNYYFNQVSGESGNKQHPYSLGIRMAVGIVPDKRR